MVEMWRFLAGLGLFLYGMNLLEHVLKKLAGRSFKLLIRRYTKRVVKAIVGGAIITGILQSSSVVSLLVLAFVESGIVTFKHALAIILGANLGTTISSWIIATVGFKLDIEGLALPVIALTTILMFFLQHRRILYNTLRLFLSLGLLFLGLAFMKSGAESLVINFDFSHYANYGAWMFVVIGFLLTSIIQSSSATVAITLTAIHSQILTFPLAAAVVIGSEVGTTIKIVLGGLGGTADKKRVALGNFLFNLATTVGALSTLYWLTSFVTDVVGIQDPLIALVFFQSMINVLSILIFAPFINLFSRWLGRMFTQTKVGELKFINRNLPIVPDLAIDALAKETLHMLEKTRSFIRYILRSHDGESGFFPNLRSFTRVTGTHDQKYESLKQSEGGYIDYYTLLQLTDLDASQYEEIRRLFSSVRLDMHAAKSMKDIYHDVKLFEESANDALHNWQHELENNWKAFDERLGDVINLTETSSLFESLTRLMRDSFDYMNAQNTVIIELLHKHNLSEVETSTLMNVQREILSIKKSLLRSLAYLKLPNEMAREFEFFPRA